MRFELSEPHNMSEEIFDGGDFALGDVVLVGWVEVKVGAVRYPHGEDMVVWEDGTS